MVPVHLCVSQPSHVSVQKIPGLLCTVDEIANKFIWNYLVLVFSLNVPLLTI